MSVNDIKNNLIKNEKELNIKGLDKNLVINKNYLNSLGDIYKCALCQNILLNPVECQICGHNFCFNCIYSTNCPYGCKDKKISKASLSLNNILKNIKFKCPNFGCTETLDYIEAENHIKECPYQKRKCERKECNEIISQKNILNHKNNESDNSEIKLKFCKDESIKKELEKKEKECELIDKKNEKINHDCDKIVLEEHFKGLLNNLNKIINNNKKLAEIFNSTKNEENIYTNRMSIRKSIVPGLETDEFFGFLKEELDLKMKKYYLDFNNNYEKVFKEIDDLIKLLNKYIKDNPGNERKINENNINKEINQYLNNLIFKLENEFKNQIVKYRENFNNEFDIINNLIENKQIINQIPKMKKDMYSLINIMFNNLSKFLSETNNNIINISKELSFFLKSLYNSYDKSMLTLKERKTNLNEKNINNKNNKIITENNNYFLKNINKDLSEIQKNFVETINLINEKFVEFSYLINNSNNNNQFKPSKSPISTLSLNKMDKESKKNRKNSNELINSISNNNELIFLNNLDNKLSFLENNSKFVFAEIKEKINSEMLSKINEINIIIEKDMDEKLDLYFSLKYCKICQKIDYYYGFIKCIICFEDICKTCILVCSKCKNFCCIKCGKCKKCDKILCINCKIKCTSCGEYFCQNCISNCIDCKNNTCNNCLFQKCDSCDKINFCLNCGKKCNFCQKIFCEKCLKNNEFSECYICNKKVCNKCFKKCKEDNKVICKSCCCECFKCKGIYSKNEIINCNKCKNKFCNKCGEEFIKNNSCKLCKSIFCQDCNSIVNNLKCFYCNKKPCFICFSKCENCSHIFCKECSNLCKSCNQIFCIKCSFECTCKNYICSKCINKNEIIYPHECIYFSNNCAITDSKKILSLKKIPNNLNIEAKFSVFMNDISDKSFLLVGIIDENKLEKNEKEIKENIFALNVNNGNKFSSKKGFESFLDFEDINKGINYVYIMMKENKLFFKVNESIYKWAYDLDKKRSYSFYVETNMNNSATKFFFIRKIK